MYVIYLSGLPVALLAKELSFVPSKVCNFKGIV